MDNRADLIDNTQLVFQFQSQNLEKRDIHDCADYVNIEGFGVFCEVTSDRHLRPSPKMIRNSSVTAVRFVSDFAAGGSGFVLSFYLEDKIKPCRCLNGGKCINSSCICQRGYEGDSCEKSSTSCSTITSINTTVITRQTTLTTEAVTTATTPTTEMPTVPTRQTKLSTEVVTTATTPTTDLASSTLFSSTAPIDTTVTTKQTTLSTEAITATTPTTKLGITGIVAELCTGQKKISLEPYVGTGIIYPENYPSIKGYEENLVCTWSIITKKGFHIVVFPVVWSCTESSVLSLFYGLTEDADIDSCIGCPFDTGFCFDLIQTRSSEVSLDLYTINVDTNGGFDFRFMAINSSLKDEGCRSSELKLRASRTPNFIISPGFPDHYPGNSDCKWTIEPDLIDNTQLVFQFQSQNLEKRDIHNCADYVNIEGFGVFCEVSSDRHLRPSPKMIRNSSVTAVRFVSDFAAGGSGFVLSFYLEDKTKPCRCLNGGKCINSSCICQRGYEGDSCEKSSTSFSTIKSIDTTVITRQTTLTTEAVTTTTTPTTEMPSSTTVSSIAPIVTTVHTGQTTQSTETVTTATTPTTELASSTTVSSIAPIVTTVPTRQTTLSTEAVTTATTPTTELASSTSFSTIKPIDTTATTRQTTLKTEAVTTATTPTTEMASSTTVSSIAPIVTAVPTRQTKLSTEAVTTATTPTTELASSILFSSTAPIDTTVTTKQTTLSTEAITSTTPTTKLATIVTTVTTRQTTPTTEAVTTATTPITEMPNILQVLLFESSKSKVREGNSVKFKVLLVSNAAYEFLWYHSGYLVTNSSTRYEISSLKTENGTLHTLFISTALQRDKGEWKIDVTNGVQCTTRNLTIMVVPRLVLQMMPQYDFSVQRDDVLMLQCTVNNPDSLHDVINGSLVIKKGNAILTDVNSTQMFASWRKSSAAEEDSGRYTCIHTGYPDPVFAMVNVAVFQPEQKRCLSEKTDDILWNTTLAGTMKQEPCPGNQKGIATRYCTSDGIWGSTNLIKCITEAYLIASSELEEIIEDGINNQEKIIEAVSSTLEVMKNLTSSSTEMSAGDLSSSMDILEKIVDVTDTLLDQ
uniref:Uncharacterized protein LOC111126761 isoform X2 n=1 Tax=Crassostrea virginica TaxID=6565 RepID=A0A8B8DHG1_CRAVI|nr:uncharacterized protein LOC111126761 isoform X2 [Crassostrea virginica]